MTRKGGNVDATRTAKPLASLPSAVGKQPAKIAPETSASIAKTSKRKAVEEEVKEDEGESVAEGAAFFDKINPRKKSNGHAQRVLPVRPIPTLSSDEGEGDASDEEDDDDVTFGTNKGSARLHLAEEPSGIIPKLIHNHNDDVDKDGASDLEGEKEAPSCNKVCIRCPFQALSAW
jgi:hypothetical protein